MSTGYFNFDVELGNLGELYAVNCFSNFFQIDGYHPRGTEVSLPENIDPNIFYCIKRMDGRSIAVKGYHLLNVSKAIGRNTLPFEAIIEAHEKYDKILNLTVMDRNNFRELLTSTEEDAENLKKYHSSYADKSKYDFSMEFIDKSFKVEVKTDSLTPVTGNIFIEFEQNTSSDWELHWDANCKPSGMKISESDIWMYLLSPEMFLFISPEALEEIYEKRFIQPLKVRMGGNKTDNENNPRSKGVVVPIHHFLDLDLSLTRENKFQSSLVKNPECSLL